MIPTLEVTTPSDREIRVTRTFNAPPQLVFDAHTKPELVKRWLLGPPGWSMPICEIDLRAGGGYRYVWRNDADGTQTLFSMTMRFDSRELRDGALESGMTGGMGMSYDRLQELIDAREIAS